jgi:thymidylate synthase
MKIEKICAIPIKIIEEEYAKMQNKHDGIDHKIIFKVDDFQSIYFPLGLYDEYFTDYDQRFSWPESDYIFDELVDWFFQKDINIYRQTINVDGGGYEITIAAKNYYLLKEYDYALQDILDKGIERPNRTGENTLSLFGIQCKYDISEHFPIPTKRKYAYKSIFAELLWMLSGSTNVNDLEAMGSKIWSAWKDKDFEKRNDYHDGELGPIYGWSFRNFGADYDHQECWGFGFDQVEYLINELKTNKYSRRALINLWDPRVMTTDKVKLTCCHYSFQVLVDNEDRLTGILSQRSGDWLPGISANIFFYSAFLYMIAQQTNMKPYMLIHNVADAHVYLNQVEAAKEYLKRPEIQSPVLKLNKAKDIFSYKLSDFEVIDYSPGETIKIPITV